MSFRNFISENIFLPLSDCVTGQCSARSFRFFEQSKHWSREQLDAFQNERLRLLVRHSVANVPYYRDLFYNLGLTADDIQTKADLCKIPIVNKSVMRREGIEHFTAEGFPEKQRTAHRSGGSTGEPFSFYTTKEENSMNLAAKLHTWYSVGYRLGDRYVKIANNERDSLQKRVQDFINNSVLIPFSNVNDDELAKTLESIEKLKPLYIRSYPMPLYLLAQFKKKHGGFRYSPKFIFTTGSTLSENYRNEIESAFGCKIIDSYSCEGNANVAQSLNCEKYHVSEEFGITEVVDADGLPIQDGVGRVVSTDLWNYAHPFIRYDTQDLVEVCSAPCECGNPRMMIKRIMGRECESFLRSNGKYITVHDLTGFLKRQEGVSNAVDGYQLVKKKDGSVTFRLVVNDGFDESLKRMIVDYWTEQLDSPVSIEIVDELPLMNNNKRLAIIEEK